MTLQTDYQLSKLLWRCKRGMLELDLILQPFVKTRFNGLSESLKADFVALLQLEDPTLYGWLMGHEAVTEARFKEIILSINKQ